MRYVDGFVLAVPKKNLKAYFKMAKKACKIWIEHGALEYRECVGDDLAVKMGLPVWQDGPATTQHAGACGFTFADGHSEIKKWLDSRSTTGRMRTTYTSGFNFGQAQTGNRDITWLQERTSVRQ